MKTPPKIDYSQKEEYKIFTDFWRQPFVNCMTKESKEFLDSLVSVFGKPTAIVGFERPDILVLYENKTLILEHFRFDSSKRKKKSSTLQKEKYVFEKSHNTRGFKILEISSQAKIEYYRDNLISTTIDHIQKYHKYMSEVSKKRAVSVGKAEPIIIHEDRDFGIVTQDMSLDFNMFRENGELSYLTPFHIKEFRDLLRANPNVKHCYHLVFDSNEKRIMYYFHNTPSNLDTLDAQFNYSSPKEIEKMHVFYWKNNV